ncbi:hypothetical protein U1Q18_052334, partial [Sarracenia purpurea var. burkii]
MRGPSVTTMGPCDTTGGGELRPTLTLPNTRLSGIHPALKFEECIVDEHEGRIRIPSTIP